MLAQDLGLDRARVDAELMKQLAHVVRDGDVIVRGLDQDVHRADELGLAERPDWARSEGRSTPLGRTVQLWARQLKQSGRGRPVNVDDAGHSQDRAADLLQRHVGGRRLEQDVAS